MYKFKRKTEKYTYRSWKHRIKSIKEKCLRISLKNLALSTLKKLLQVTAYCLAYISLSVRERFKN